MSNPIGWFEIYVNDMQRAKAFYEGVLGVALTRLDSPDPGSAVEMWAFPMDSNVYGASGTLAKMPGVAAGGNSTLIYFSCTDCAVEAARAVKHGGKVQKAKTSIGPYGHIALLFDTEGNTIGLHSMQ
jgi:hypothetical protein